MIVRFCNRGAVPLLCRALLRPSLGFFASSVSCPLRCASFSTNTVQQNETDNEVRVRERPTASSISTDSPVPIISTASIPSASGQTQQQQSTSTRVSGSSLRRKEDVWDQLLSQAMYPFDAKEPRKFQQSLSELSVDDKYELDLLGEHVVNEIMQPGKTTDMEARVKQNAEFALLPDTAAEFFATRPRTLENYLILIRVNIAKKKLEGGVEVYNDLIAHKLTPNEDIIVYMVKLCGQAGKIKLAEKYLNKAMGFKIPRSTRLYSAFMYAHSMSPKPDVAAVFTVLRSMKAFHVKPDVRIYTSMIKACWRGMQISKAWEVFSTLMPGDHVEPSPVTYNLMLRVCASAGAAEKAILLFNQMKQKQMRMSNYTYSGIILACASRPEFYADAFKYFVQAQREGYKFDAYLVHALMLASVRRGDLRQVHLLFCDMETAFGVKKELRTYKYYLAAIAHSQKFNRILLSSDATTTNNSEAKDKAEKHEEKEKEKKEKEKNKSNANDSIVVVDEVEETKLQIKSLEQKKQLNMRDRIQLAHAVVNEIAKISPIKQDIADLLFSVYSKSLLAPEAVQAWETLYKKYNAKHTFISYMHLLRMYMRLKRVPEVIDTFDRMKNDKIKPSLMTYKILLRFFSSKVEYRVFYESIVTEMQRRGLEAPPTPAIFRSPRSSLFKHQRPAILRPGRGWVRRTNKQLF